MALCFNILINLKIVHLIACINNIYHHKILNDLNIFHFEILIIYINSNLQLQFHKYNPNFKELKYIIPFLSK